MHTLCVLRIRGASQRAQLTGSLGEDLQAGWTASRATPDQTQIGIWKTLDKPHSPEDIVSASSSSERTLILTSCKPGGAGTLPARSWREAGGSGSRQLPESEVQGLHLAKFATDQKKQKSRPGVKIYIEVRL